MKIIRVTHHVVNVPETRWWWSDDVYGQPEYRRADRGVVEVETDAGITGIGEATTEYHELAVKAQVETELRSRLLGLDPTDPDTPC